MNSIDIFKNYYKETKDKLNKKINKFNKELEQEDNLIIKNNINLFSSLNSDGKLIRGTLVKLGYKLISDNNYDYSDYLSLAFEVFQTAILVHDDIIDNDDLRRGKETIHAYNYKRYESITKDSLNSKKNAESIAICMGDFGLYHANQIIAKNYKEDSNLGNILIYFNDIVLKTIKGELLDVVLPFNQKYDIDINAKLEENIMLIYKLKTAYYTIIGPLCLGMLLGCSNQQKIDEITSFGYNVGIAFQIQDDIIGIYNDSSVIGKVTGSDIREFKQTILYSYVYDKKEYLDELMKYYGKDEITQDDILKVQEIFKKSGSLDYALNKVETNYNEAINKINKMDWLNENNKKILEGFVLYLKTRNK